jgi:hypothetical protein
VASPIVLLATSVPTPLVTATLPVSEPPRFTPTPVCTPNLTFLSDLTIPDGTQVAPGATLDKRWQVENSGSCNWDANYRVKLIAGEQMGAPAEQALYPARSGTQATLRILFTAPTQPGTYRSAWQAFDPNGQPFGDVFFIEVVVVQP